MVGFTFAYGSMFAKVWVVHRLGAADNQQLISRPATSQVGLFDFPLDFVICAIQEQMYTAAAGI